MKINWLEFEEARKIANELKLINKEKWSKYISGKSKELLVPSNPQKVYRSQWKGWGDWLGTGNKVGGKRKYTINQNFFKKWSRNMAYIFGLWFADGCICKVNRNFIFSITQHKKDKYLIEKILSIIKSNHPLYFDRKNKDNCLSFQISSKTIVEDIINLGGKYRKSLDCSFPHIPKKYLPDFIRGEFDGDGCIYYDKNGKAYRSDICSGSKVFIDKMLEILRKEIPGFRGHISQKTSQCKLNDSEKISTIYHIQCGTNDTIRLGNFIYPPRTKLKMLRKYDLFTQATINLASKGRKFWKYKKARNFIAKLKLKNQAEWKIYYQFGEKPIQIPTNPGSTYKNKGWISLGHWLGTGTVATQKRQFATFSKAIKFVKKLKLKNRKEWSKYCKSSNKPANIPTHPDNIYKNKGWVSLGHWLGTGAIATHNRQHMTFFEARKYVKKLNIKSSEEWIKYAKYGLKQINIPHSPSVVYKNKGWTNWMDYLGYNNKKGKEQILKNKQKTT